ncbi:MAG: hypothetical protein KGL59_05925 [Acidobacteriota bacterium]|nr:hypothetical protein [Acidobacteriota bacterium]
MRVKVLGGVIGSLLLAFHPALAGPPATPLGSMRSQGAVEVNGVAALNGMNVYAGNRIVTSRGAVAVVMLAAGDKLALGSTTSVSLASVPQGLLVKLDRGDVGVVSEAKTPLLVQVGGVTIRAGNRAGAFEVIVKGRSLRVVAQHGPVMAEAANQTVRIDEGKTLKTRLDPVAEGTGRGMRTIVIVAGVAGAAGLAAAISSLSGSSKQTCVSPSQLSCP